MSEGTKTTTEAKRRKELKGLKGREEINGIKGVRN